MNKDPLTEVRADIWLWAARFFKTRSLAKQMLIGGKVQIGGQAIKPSRMLRSGDILQVNRANELYEISVLVLSEQRGPAAVAQTLYSESEASRMKRESEREMKRLANAGYRAPLTKPDKRARRLIQALGDIDAL
ncbi:MAG: RNA-binding S4 domain-containing protein [Arenimonas sp.]|jgi:ribosome-associated heat shock protein Hsp15|uniref:RNA-binding S4 domain-containing protein n=1 Tax=Arenimonas sp. TaxID=1872635 RepID=UPI001B4296F4|nr:RNA-binding S4 domain-containing protein [Arenimonas sp.]